MNKEDLAKEAERVGREPVLNYALDEMRKDSLEELVLAPPGELEEIAKYQAQVRAIDEFRERLESYMRDGEAATARPVA